jgi:hypothetical protein
VEEGPLQPERAQRAVDLPRAVLRVADDRRAQLREVAMDLVPCWEVKTKLALTSHPVFITRSAKLEQLWAAPQ